MCLGVSGATEFSALVFHLAEPVRDYSLAARFTRFTTGFTVRR
jgi:hypothetical protein